MSSFTILRSREPGRVAAVGSNETMMERLEFVDIGAPQTEFPVKEVRITTSETVPAIGFRRYSDSIPLTSGHPGGMESAHGRAVIVDEVV